MALPQRVARVMNPWCGCASTTGIRMGWRTPQAVLPAALSAARNVAGEVLVVRRIDDG